MAKTIILRYNKGMKKTKIIEGRRCPKCGKVENQANKGFNKSGTQKVFCKECGAHYTIDPKRREYPEETQELALKIYYSGVSG
ncbi:MAG: hypothetical protein LBU67_07555, partial [Oscillospiraceae bacterium]|nr:hypothetical protein [Oscillospiraceae bacterium]